MASVPSRAPSAIDDVEHRERRLVGEAAPVDREPLGERPAAGAERGGRGAVGRGPGRRRRSARRAAPGSPPASPSRAPSLPAIVLGPAWVCTHDVSTAPRVEAERGRRPRRGPVGRSRPTCRAGRRRAGTPRPSSPRRNRARTSRSSCTSVAGWSSMKPASCTGVGGVITAVPKPASSGATVTRPPPCGPSAAERYAASTTATAARPSAAVTVGAPLAPRRRRGARRAASRSSRGAGRGSRSPSSGQERERRAGVEVERALGADDRELLVGARPRRPAGVHRCRWRRRRSRTSSCASASTSPAGPFEERRRPRRCRRRSTCADDVDDVHAEVDEAPAARRGSVEEPGGPGRPRLRARVPEGGAEAGDVAEATVGDEAARRPRTAPRTACSGTARAPRRSRSAAAIISSASATVHAIGLSTSTCLPAAAAATATSWCCAFGVATTTASTSSRDDGVLPAVHDGAAAPLVARPPPPTSGDRLANTVTSAPADRERGQVDVVGRGAAADDREAGRVTRRSRSATLRTAVATSSQSRSV